MSVYARIYGWPVGRCQTEHSDSSLTGAASGYNCPGMSTPVDGCRPAILRREAISEAISSGHWVASMTQVECPA